MWNVDIITTQIISNCYDDEEIKVECCRLTIAGITTLFHNWISRCIYLSVTQHLNQPPCINISRQEYPTQHMHNLDSDLVVRGPYGLLKRSFQGHWLLIDACEELYDHPVRGFVTQLLQLSRGDLLLHFVEIIDIIICVVRVGMCLSMSLGGVITACVYNWMQVCIGR